jgi:ribosomal protein S18 acetylase RimI-like enzyme
MTQHLPAAVVREAKTDADGQAFAVFFRQAWLESGPAAPGFAGASDQAIEELTVPAAIRRRMGGPDQRLFLAWEQGSVVGFASSRRIDAVTVELAGIIVLRSAAGRGVGSALVDAAIGSARIDGYKTMNVRTETSNQLALEFYRKRGFTGGVSAVEMVEDTPIEVEELDLLL